MTSPETAIESRRWNIGLIGMALAVLTGALVYAWVLGPGQHRTPVASAPSPAPVLSTGPVDAQTITSRATDRYVYVADVLGQLASHPHASCRDGVTGSHGLQAQWNDANSLKQQGRSQDAATVLIALETKLDAKFKAGCLKLG